MVASRTSRFEGVTDVIRLVSAECLPFLSTAAEEQLLADTPTFLTTTDNQKLLDAMFGSARACNRMTEKASLFLGTLPTPANKAPGSTHTVVHSNADAILSSKCLSCLVIATPFDKTTSNSNCIGYTCRDGAFFAS